MLRFCWLRAPLPIPHLATRAVILVRDQEVEGSNPFAPTTLFRINNLYHTRATRKCEERLARNQASLFHALGRKRSLFFEFIALQREVRFTDNSVFGKVGTGSGFWRKIKKPSPNPAFCQDVILLLRSLRATIQGKSFHCHFVRAAGPFARSADHWIASELPVRPEFRD
jgi:hypothetical protein